MDSADMDSSLWIDKDDLQVIQSAYSTWAERLPGAQRSSALRLLHHLAPDQWVLEWALPLWMGRWLGLSRNQAQLVSLANVMGLAYVRLEDDRLDGEADGMPTILAQKLFEGALSVYQDLFEPTSEFWGTVDRALAIWRHAQEESLLDLGLESTDLDEEIGLRLGRRGAPLTIGANAILFLAGRTDLISSFEMLIAYRNGASVLLDHAQDWHADLMAQRPNLFVVTHATVPQESQFRSRILKEMVETLISRRAGDYFHRIDSLVGHAREIALTLEFHLIADYFEQWRLGARRFESRIYEPFNSDLHQLFAIR